MFSFRNSFLVVVASLVFGATYVPAQIASDPTKDSDLIQKTMSKIQDVEKLDQYIQQNEELKKANKELKAEIASIKKQLDKLNKNVKDQEAKLRKQLLNIPTFDVAAKILGGGNDMAILKMKDRKLRIRTDTKISVPVKDGVWVLMQVKKISKEMIELYFPELERTVYLYD